MAPGSDITINASELALDPSGDRVWFTDTQTLAEVNLASGAIHVVKLPVRNVDAITAAPVAGLLVAWDPFDLDGVSLLDPVTGEFTITSR